MGQQQMLLIIIGVIIISIAIAVGIELFGATSVNSNRDAIINDMNNIAADAYQYRMRLTNMGGGGGSYEKYKIPKKMATNEDAKFEVTPLASSITLLGTSSISYGTVQCIIDSTGLVTNFSYTGEFK